jgi:chromosomal replication initiator protein
MSELNDITLEVLSLIKERFETTPTIFNLWFDKLQLVSLSGEKAVFKTPTPLKKKILEKQYYSTISEAISEIIGFDVEIEFILDDEALKNTTIEDVDFNDYQSEESQEDKDERNKNISSLIGGEIPSQNQKILSEYTFENFIEGASNKFARAACYAVANEPTYYNPLFIYGHSGLGKTHLLYAVINELKKNHPNLKIVYKRSEDFINELIDAIQNQQTAAFKEKYRTADVLLIDDIQFISGKVATQEEFFHTFSTLYEANKQIILTSDRPPKEIKPLEDRLRTRFEGGLLADVQPPSFELRTAIIKKKADNLGLLISNDMVDYMAERLQNNIRQIEGALKRLNALYSLSGVSITKESIDQTISIIDPGNIPTDALVEKILSTVSSFYSISVDNLKSNKRNDAIANARHVAMYLIKNLTELTLKSIGEIFNRNYSTVISSISKVELNIKTKNNASIEIKKLIKEIKSQ